MFQSENVGMQLAKATMKIAQDDRQVEHRMAECALVLEPLPRELALELGEDVAAHFFTEGGAVRSDVKTVALDPRVPTQQVEVREVVDLEPTVTLRLVDILGLAVAHQHDKKSGDEWFKATVTVRFSLAERSHRDFLARCFGLRLLWSFREEQGDLLESSDDRAATSAIREFVEDTQKRIKRGGITSITMTGQDGRGMKITGDGVESVEPRG